VSNPRNDDKSRLIVDEINYAPVTHSNAPLVLVAPQFLASCGPGIVGQCPIRVNTESSSESSSLCAECLISSEYLATGACAFQAGRAILLVRNALFFPPRFRHKTVPKIFPEGAVFFQVDENPDLAALLIGDELDSGHEFNALQK
jgi:hypothetical protein